MSDILDDMVAWENGELSQKEVAHLFQFLSDNNMLSTLQGYYGRTAVDLHNAGLIDMTRKASDGISA